MHKKPDFKTETQRAYDAYPTLFDEKFGEFFENFGRHLANKFMTFLEGKKILDVGCGPGHYAEYFQQKQYDVTCVDISPEMVRLALSRGLTAEVGDIEKLRFPAASFDGVWANAVLLHLPRAQAPAALAEIARVLVPGGVAHISVKEGQKEGFEERSSQPDTKRWFSHLTDEEMRNLVQPTFRVLSFTRTDVEGKFNFLDYDLRKN